MGAQRTDPDAPRGPSALPWVGAGIGAGAGSSGPPAHPVLPWLPESARVSPTGSGVGSRAVPPPARRPSPVRTLVARWGGHRLVIRWGWPRLVGLLVAVTVVVVATAVALVDRGTPTVTTPFLSYTPPVGWTVEPADADAPPDAPALVGRVRGPGYTCDGEPSVRGYAGAALLPVDAGSGPADRVARVARWFAATSYATPGTATAPVVAPARPVRVPGPGGPVDATVTEVTVQVAGAGGCATAGTVLALAAPVSGGVALLLVAGDTGGGPAQPPPPDRATLDAVLASVRLGPR